MDLQHLISTYGPIVAYVGIFVILFAESGLFIGFFLPGDSVLFTAGFLASQHLLSLPVLLVICFIAAVLGDNVGYQFGHRVGPRLFSREDSVLFHKKNVVKAQEFYDKHGAMTIVLARFIPIVRTFAPIVAGIGQMKWRTFFTYNLIGGVLWAIGLNLVGFFLGQIIPESVVNVYLPVIIVLLVVIPGLPSLYHILSDAETRNGIINMGKQIMSRGKQTPTTPPTSTTSTVNNQKTAEPIE